MLFLVILGFALRWIFIDKPDGLWNDEYVSWQIASIPLGKGFWDAVFAQCHMPFYYFYLKFVMHFFGNSDLVLRLSSFVPGILAIVSMYFVGKEFKDSRLGILCAAVTSLSSFLIYFSQEVRFYELLFLFSSLLLLYTLKLLKKQNILNLVLFITFNLLIIFTHTIGFLFVLFNLVFVSYYLSKKEHLKKIMKITWGVVGLFFLIGVPLLFKIFTANTIAQWWSPFSVSQIAFLFTDYFSPVLTNIVSAPEKFFRNISFAFVVFELLPTLIALFGIVKALKSKDKNLLGLSYVSLTYLLILLVFSISGKLVFLTKYTLEIYPTLILLMAFGLLEIKNGWRKFLIFVFCFLNLFYILTNPLSAPKVHRSEGHKIVADLLKDAKLKKGDTILLNYYSKDRFEKYFDFRDYNVISINKSNFAQYLGVSTKDEFKNIDESYFTKQFRANIESKVGKGHKLVILVLNDVARYSPIQMQVISQDKKVYKKTPFLFLVFSEFKNKELEEGIKNLRIQRLAQKGSWSLITFVGAKN